MKAMGAEVRSGLTPSRTLAERIARCDPAPAIRVFCVGHEGIARGRLVGRGRGALRYSRAAAQALAGALRPGTPVFAGHGRSNGRQGRPPIGEVVGRAAVERNGRLEVLAAIWLYPAFRHCRLDVASVEADVEYALDDQGRARVERVVAVTAVALADGARTAPGFSGAVLQSGADGAPETHFNRGGEGMAMTAEELRQAAAEENLAPSEVFGAEALLADPVVAELAGKVEALERTAAEARQRAVFEDLARRRRLDDRQKAFLERRMEERRLLAGAEGDGDGAEAVNRFLDDQIRDCREAAALFGAPAGAGAVRQGTPASDGVEGGGDLTDPACNPLIPVG